MFNVNLTQAILIGLRNQGHSVPNLTSNAAATTHFGGSLAEGKRFYNTVTRLIMVYDGDQWVVQKTS